MKSVSLALDLTARLFALAWADLYVIMSRWCVSTLKTVELQWLEHL